MVAHQRVLVFAVICLLPLAGVGRAEQRLGPTTQPGVKPYLPDIAAKLAAGKQPVKVVCFGDSVTGLYYHTGGRRAYTEMVAIGLKKTFPEANVTAINAGISGHTTRNALQRIDTDVLAYKPDVVTVMFGLNDMARVPLDEYSKNLVTIIEKCRGIGARVVLCTPNSVINTSGRPITKLVQYCDAVRRVAAEQKVPLCDCYAACEALHQRNPLVWRLLMSDEIHPNMDGHKLIAETIAKTITGKTVSLAKVGPLQPSIPKTLGLLKNGKPIKVLAMPPFDALIGPALKQINGNAQIEVTTWPTADKTLPQLEQDAKSRVRKLRPDLVIIAVPRSAGAASTEQFIRSFSWIMNWSLSFGAQQWDCVVVHPAVANPANAANPADAAAKRDALIRQLVKAQDLSLIDRSTDDRSEAAGILVNWLRSQSH